MLRLNREITDNAFHTENQMNSNISHTSQSPKSALVNKLQQLEKKQYELTKQVNKSSIHVRKNLFDLKNFFLATCICSEKKYSEIRPYLECKL